MNFLQYLKRPIQYRVWLPTVNVLVYNATIYADGLVGITRKDLEKAIETNYIITEEGICKLTPDPEDSSYKYPELLYSLIEGDDWYWIANECYIMQFTGQLDLNGNPIYEGDLTNYGTVVFADGCFTLNTTALLKISDITVIGNIFENEKTK